MTNRRWNGVCYTHDDPDDTSTTVQQQCVDDSASRCLRVLLRRGGHVERHAAGKTTLFEALDGPKYEWKENSHETVAGLLLRGASVVGEMSNAETPLSIATSKCFEAMFPDDARRKVRQFGTAWISAASKEEGFSLWECIDSTLERGDWGAAQDVERRTRVRTYMMIRYVFAAQTHSYYLPPRVTDTARELWLQSGESISRIAPNVNGRYWIAQYRGVFYSANYFTAQHSEWDALSSHLNRPLPAGATFSMIGALPQQPALTRDSAGRTLSNEIGLWPCADAYAAFEIAANDYEEYNRQVRDGSGGQWQEKMKQLKAFGYPTWASSDFPRHALKYALGKGATYQDPVYASSAAAAASSTIAATTAGTSTAATLTATTGAANQTQSISIFNADGSPKQRCFGKIYMVLASPDEVKKAIHVVELERQKHVRIIVRILPERETGWIGMLELGHTWCEMALPVPDLSLDWKPEFKKQFGLTEQKWNNAREKLRLNPNDIDTLSEHLENWTAELLHLSTDEAHRRGGTLKYYDPNDSVRDAPMHISSTLLAIKYERDAIQAINKSKK